MSLTKTTCVLVYNNLYGRVRTRFCNATTEANLLYFQIFLFLWFLIPTLVIASTVGGIFNVVFSICSPLRRLLFCFRGLLTNNHKDILKWDRLCRRYTVAQMNIILLYQRNINEDIFRSFLAHLATVDGDERLKEV